MGELRKTYVRLLVREHQTNDTTHVRIRIRKEGYSACELRRGNNKYSSDRFSEGD